jgi:hypothetical protein
VDFLADGGENFCGESGLPTIDHTRAAAVLALGEFLG